MPRSISIISALLILAVAASACAATAAPPSDTPATDAPMPTTDQATPTADPTAGAPAPGTDLDACEIVTAADIAAATGLEEVDIPDGELAEKPTSLSPGHTECRYSGDWGGLIVALTPEDGANLYDAARGSYADASDREVTGADGAFWSEQNKRGFFWKGAVTVMLQVTHLASGADRGEMVTAIGQAAIDKVD